MLIVTTLPGRGKLGGVVASITRQSTRFHARSPHKQPMTPSQRNSGAITLSLAQQWRGLSESERIAWNDYAAIAQSGYQTFIACNRRLATIGVNTVLTAPAVRPTLPPLTAFAVTPIYSGGGPPTYLDFWQIDTAPEQDGTYALVVRATQCLSQAKANIRPSDLRIIAAGTGQGTPAYVPVSSWYRAWGSGPSVGWVTFTLALVDPASGISGPAVTARTYLDASPNPGPGTFEVTIQQEGTTIAVTGDQIYTQDNEAIAGP